MKKTISALLLGASLAITALLSLTSQKRNPLEAKAYTTSSLTTTIKLNDCSDKEIRDYYASLDGQSLNGTSLLTALKSILSQNQRYYSYDKDKESIWKMYEIVDRDWEKSPAEDLLDPLSNTYGEGTYSIENNIITNYSYNTFDPYIHALYVNRDVENLTTAWSDHQQTQWGINQEHIWAKSNGFDDEKGTGQRGGARGDPMHLWASNGRVNGDTHSNYNYAFVNTSLTYNDAGSYASTLAGNLRGKSLTMGDSNTVFEPQDSDKGDIARAIFYMAARYNYYVDDDEEIIDADNPNLELVQSSETVASGFTSSKTTTGKMGVLTDLLEWNRIDPPDEFEIHRNNLLYRNYTKNRNPFIDFPEWADYIWGTATYNGRSFVSYDNTPTGNAAPASNIINGWSSDPILINNARIIASKDVSCTLSATSSNSSTISWTTSDSNIVAISAASSASGANITLNPKAYGSAVITATATVGGKQYSKTCLVRVHAQPTLDILDAAALNLSESGYQTWNSITDNTEAVYSGYSYKANYIQLNTTSPAGIVNTTSPGNVTSITINWNNSTTNGRTVQIYGKSTAYSGPVDLYSNGTMGTLLGSVVKGTSTKLDINGDYPYIGIKAQGGGLYIDSIVIQYDIDTPEPVITSIEATCDKAFKVGDTITKSDITVTANTGATINDFDFDNYQFTYADAPSGGSSANKQFTVQYGNLEDTFNASVSRVAFTEFVDTLTRSTTGVDSNSYTSWSNKTVNTSAKYAGNSAGGNSSIQLRSSSDKSGNYAGVISTTSGGNARVVMLEWNASTADGRTVQIYGNNAAYSSANDLFSDTPATQGTLLGELNKGDTRLVINGDYAYIGIRSKSNALYLSSLTIAYDSTAANVANYIMYEDTANQCTTKFDNAALYFECLTIAERVSFMTSANYVLTAARTRLNAWAANQGKEINHVNSDYLIEDRAAYGVPLVKDNDGDASPALALLVILSLGGIAAFLLARKRRSE